MKTLLYILVGVVIGIWMIVAIVKLIPEPVPECVVGQVELALRARIVIGEAVVCGEFHSDIYGPDIRAWTGEIKFYHDHEEE